MQNTVLNSKVFVRIVILNYNESDFTISLIEQLSHQSFKNFDIIVVDNNSVDLQKQKLRDGINKEVIIFSKSNLGYAAGNNLGLKYNDGKKVDYYLVLNNDLIIEDDNFILTLLDGMILKKDTGVVASSPLIDTISTNIPIENQIQVRKLLPKFQTFLINIPIFKFITNRWLKREFLYMDDMPFLNKHLICDSINGAAFIIDASFIKVNNYLDEGTFLYYEELILGKQIQLVKKTCLLNGNTYVKHLQGVSSKSNTQNINIKMERFKYKSSLYYLNKYENLGWVGSKLYILLSEFVIFLKKIKK